MKKHNFTETTTVNNKVFFAGEAEISDADTHQPNVQPQTEQSTSPFPEDYPGYDVLGQVEGMTPEKLASMSDEEISAIDGIGAATLKKIRAYGK